MTKYLLIFLTISLFSFSQNLYFPKNSYNDSVLFAKNIPFLAKQVITKYKNLDKDNYQDNIFRMHVVAQNYKTAPLFIDSIATNYSSDSLANKAVGFPYRSYCGAKCDTKNNSFHKAYTEYFQKKYSTFSKTAALWVEDFYGNDLSQLIIDLKTLIKHQGDFKSDSIDLNSALKLCRKYCSWMVYTQTQDLAKQILKNIENEKYVSNDSVVLKMSDGATISLTVVRPKLVKTALPAILMFSIYPGSDHGAAKRAAENGYVGVIANTRGKRLSNDEVEPFEHDAKDAYEIIDWISKQSWCNGKLGMYGGSYLGFAQWSATKKLHPALKTIVPQVAVGIGIDYPVQNGIFMGYSLRWIHYVSNNKLTDYSEFTDNAKWLSVATNWYESGKSFRTLDSIDGRPNKIFQRWLDHPSYDSYWQNMTPQKEEFAKINIPILTITGYYDDDQLGAMHYFKEHHKWNKNTNHYLLIGPYDHYGPQGYPSTKLGGYKIDSAANIPISEIVFKWFNHILKDSIKPEILKDKINFEIMGANKWCHVPSLNKMSNDTLTLYLSNIKCGDYYKLGTDKPMGIEYIKEEVDLTARKKIPNLNENGMDILPLIDTCIRNPERHLVFVGSPLEKEISISGSMLASIKASINKRDMDLVIDLYEEMPDGNFFRLTEDIQRASLAKDKSNRQLLQPDKIETIPFSNTFITSKRLQKGSKIVIIVGINKNVNWQVNYGTGKDVSIETINDAKEPLLIKWYNTSTIKLPVLR